MDYRLIFNNSFSGEIFDATKLCEGEIKWETQRIGNPGKLTFKIVRDVALSFFEGSNVQLYVKEKPVFSGFVFVKERNKEQIISVTAYDQLRYLKNKHYYIYANKTAAEVVKMIAGDFFLRLGEIEDTGYVIAAREEDNQTLMDIIYTALDLTLVHTGKLFVLYDDFGTLRLQNVKNMILPLVYDSQKGNMTDFKYKTDIDSDTYNRVRLIKENAEAGRREAFEAYDSGNISRWGVLQYFDKVNDNLSDAQIQKRAEEIIAMKNRVRKFLTLEALGDIGVRAGNSIYVNMPDIGETSVNQTLLISRCTHTFKNNEHTMCLELEGNIQ